MATDVILSSISAQRDLNKRTSKAHARWDLPSNLVDKIKDQYFCHALKLTLSSGAIMECDNVDTKKDQEDWAQQGKSMCDR